MTRSGGRSSGRSGGFGGRGYSRSTSTGRASPNYNSYRQGGYTTSPPRSSPYQTRPSATVGTGGLGSTIAHGMAFGGGSAIAHHAIGSLLGRPYAREPQVQGGQNESLPVNTDQTYNQQQTNPCYDLNIKFIDCLKINDDISKCQNIFDDLKICEKKIQN